MISLDALPGSSRKGLPSSLTPPVQKTEIHSLKDYFDVWSSSLQDTNRFWENVAQTQVTWRKKWGQVSTSDFKKGHVSWFVGGELNVSENCLDRHVQAGLGQKKALIWGGKFF